MMIRAAIKTLRLLVGVLLAVVALAACGGQPDGAAQGLQLKPDKANFLFFFTDP